ncbi:MAG: leucine-rich repeat domain-containing protein [Oscillospiraceae bacterium]|nr:leucine-rich repeat domain-containing protein [Oscillospiraceae bacterium]
MYDVINKHFARLLAVLLAFVLAFSGAVSAFADETSEAEISSETESAAADESTVSEETASEVVPETRTASGSCGPNLSWSFSAGTLTISGSGAMDDFPESTFAPWYGFRDEIVRLNLPSGLTSVGDLAFYECKNLTAVTIPSSVTNIGRYSFTYCSGMKILSLGNGVKTIEEAAFSDCYALTSLSLPNGLQTIGQEAFYRCESITTVTIPASVTKIGMLAFGYCKNLVSATVNANVSEIPEFMFYKCQKLSSIKIPDSVENIGDNSFRGCDNLGSVYYNGENMSVGKIHDALDDEVAGFEGTGSVSEGEISGSVSSGTTYEKEDGSFTQENTTVTETEKTTVSTTITTDYTVVMPEEITGETLPEVSEGNSSVDISISVKDDQGWTEVIEETEKVLDKHGHNNDGSEKHVNISLYLDESGTIDSGFIEAIAGKDVTVTVMASDGSVWKIDGKNVDTAELSGEYNLAYVIEAVPPEVCADFGVSTAFVLKFLAPAQINAEVLIYIGTPFGRQNATLFQKNKELDRLQSVVVDNEGYAHFYLGSVSEKTEYYIAMNLPDAAGEALIPENMLAEYGNPEYIEPIKYEITGRTSSWGMNLGQVMGILGGVMAGVVILVGGIMFIWNRQRLKNGYVPKFDDEE